MHTVTTKLQSIVLLHTQRGCSSFTLLLLCPMESCPCSRKEGDECWIPCWWECQWWERALIESSVVEFGICSCPSPHSRSQPGTSSSLHSSHPWSFATGSCSTLAAACHSQALPLGAHWSAWCPWKLGSISTLTILWTEECYTVFWKYIFVFSKSPADEWNHPAAS